MFCLSVSAYYAQTGIILTHDETHFNLIKTGHTHTHTPTGTQKKEFGCPGKFSFKSGLDRGAASPLH